MIRVGLLGPSLIAGGAERWMLDLVRLCDPRRIRWTVCLIGYGWCDAEVRATLAKMIPVHQDGKIHHRGSVRVFPEPAARELLFAGSDVVIGWELDTRLANWTEATDAIVINVAHRQDPSLAQSVRPRHHLAAVWKCCRYTFGIDRAGEVHIIPNGVDLDRCRPRQPRGALRAAWGCDDSNVVIGYLGRIAPEKNCAAVARAAAALGARGRGILYGSPGAYAAEILSEIRLTAPNRVLAFPSTQDIGSVLHASDVFMLPSRSEGMSLSLLEAWAAEVPVVATPVGALPDLESSVGRLVVRIDPDTSGAVLADAVSEAIRGSKRAEIVARARALVEGRFTTSRMASQWTDYLCSISTGARRRWTEENESVLGTPPSW